MNLDPFQLALFQVHPAIWFSIFKDELLVPWIYAYDPTINEIYVGGIESDWENWADLLDGISLEPEVLAWIRSCEQTVLKIKQRQAARRELAGGSN